MIAGEGFFGAKESPSRTHPKKTILDFRDVGEPT